MEPLVRWEGTARRIRGKSATARCAEGSNGCAGRVRGCAAAAPTVRPDTLSGDVAAFPGFARPTMAVCSMLAAGVVGFILAGHNGATNATRSIAQATGQSGDHEACDDDDDDFDDALIANLVVVERAENTLRFLDAAMVSRGNIVVKTETSPMRRYRGSAGEQLTTKSREELQKLIAQCTAAEDTLAA